MFAGAGDMVSFLKSRPELETGAAYALAPIVFVMVAIGIGYALFVPPERLPISGANGTYANACCGALVLEDGHASAGAKEFAYVIQHDKNGPFILPTSHRVTIHDGSRLGVTPNEAALILRLDPSATARWIDIPDFDIGHSGREYRFTRLP